MKRTARDKQQHASGRRLAARKEADAMTRARRGARRATRLVNARCNAPDYERDARNMARAGEREEMLEAAAPADEMILYAWPLSGLAAARARPPRQMGAQT